MPSDPVRLTVLKNPKKKREKKSDKTRPILDKRESKSEKKSEIVRGNAGRESRAFSKPVRSSEEKRKF